MVDVTRPMGSTTRIPPLEWEARFDRFSREYLAGGRTETVTLEVLSPASGDQIAAAGARLLGLSYDPKGNLFEIQLEGVAHLVYRPSDIWVIEDDRGFISMLEIVRDDGTSELLYVKGSGPERTAQAPAAPPAS